MAFIERRSFPRLPFCVEIEYQKVSLPEASTASKAMSNNISPRGIRLITPEKLSVDTLLNIVFSIPGEKRPLRVTGKVIWVEKFDAGTLGPVEAYDSGIEFVEISPSDKEMITRYMLPRSS